MSWSQKKDSSSSGHLVGDKNNVHRQRDWGSCGGLNQVGKSVIPVPILATAQPIIALDMICTSAAARGRRCRSAGAIVGLAAAAAESIACTTVIYKIYTLG